MEEKFYFNKKIEVRLNEREKEIFDEIASLLKSEVGTESDNDSEVARLAIDIASKNKHLIDMSKIDDNFNEADLDSKFALNIENFIKNISHCGT